MLEDRAEGPRGEHSRQGDSTGVQEGGRVQGAVGEGCLLERSALRAAWPSSCRAVNPSCFSVDEGRQ